MTNTNEQTVNETEVTETVVVKRLDVETEFPAYFESAPIVEQPVEVQEANERTQ